MIILRHPSKKGRGLHKGVWAVVLLAGSLALGVIGCGPPTENVLVGADGTAIRLAQITEIKDNANMTDEEKWQAVRDLGITDENLIDILLK